MSVYLLGAVSSTWTVGTNRSYLQSYELGTWWEWLVIQGMAVIFVGRRTEVSMTSHWKRVIRAQ